jgi:co-chaperonin GroES (HSP10)
MTNTEPFDWSIEGKIRPIANRVLVVDMEHGEKLTKGGIIILNDDNVERGIRPRWATVYAVGKDVEGITVGDKILVSHGRWSRGIKTTMNGESKVVRMVEAESILLVSEEENSRNL